MTRKRHDTNRQRLVLRPGRQVVEIGPNEARQILRDYPSGRITRRRLVDFMVRRQRGDIAPGAVHWLSDSLDIMVAFMDGAYTLSIGGVFTGDLVELDAEMRQRAEALARAEWEAGNGYPTAGVCPRHVIYAAIELGNMTGLEYAFLMAVRQNEHLLKRVNADIRADNERFAAEQRLREAQSEPDA
jgi:hypothetical protein